MAEVSCQNCVAACCKGNPLLTMQLSTEEVAFMRAGGNVFQTVAEPADHDRDDVIYPVGMQVYPDRGTFQWQVERGREHEPLPAGFGRYALVGACKYLETDANGWERCSVYDQRPAVCRNFQLASPKCLTFRIREGVDTLEAVLEEDT
jgi:Fe-S-cluster containining protein